MHLFSSTVIHCIWSKNKKGKVYNIFIYIKYFNLYTAEKNLHNSDYSDL